MATITTSYLVPTDVYQSPFPSGTGFSNINKAKVEDGVVAYKQIPNPSSFFVTLDPTYNGIDNYNSYGQFYSGGNIPSSLSYAVGYDYHSSLTMAHTSLVQTSSSRFLAFMRVIRRLRTVSTLTLTSHPYLIVLKSRK